MLKMFLGFVVFAALAMYVIFKGGDSLDMTGEKHGAESTAPAEAPKSEAAQAPAPAAEEAKTPAAAAAK